MNPEGTEAFGFVGIRRERNYILVRFYPHTSLVVSAREALCAADIPDDEKRTKVSVK